MADAKELLMRYAKDYDIILTGLNNRKTFAESSKSAQAEIVSMITIILSACIISEAIYSTRDEIVKAIKEAQ